MGYQSDPYGYPAQDALARTRSAAGSSPYGMDDGQSQMQQLAQQIQAIIDEQRRKEMEAQASGGKSSSGSGGGIMKLFGGGSSGGGGGDLTGMAGGAY